jgi:nucleotide-binding universal stress UspA family protein
MDSDISEGPASLSFVIGKKNIIQPVQIGRSKSRKQSPGLPLRAGPSKIAGMKAVRVTAELDDSIARLKAAGIKAYAHLARGDTVPTIVAYSKKLAVDLIVAGHYPTTEGRRWWAGPEREPLAEQLDCCLFIAANEGT